MEIAMCKAMLRKEINPSGKTKFSDRPISILNISTTLWRIHSFYIPPNWEQIKFKKNFP